MAKPKTQTTTTATPEDEKLKALRSAEKAARDLYLYWTGRAHPNSIKMSQIKAQHHKAMMDMIAYQEEHGIPTQKVMALPLAPTIEDLEAGEGVVAYESGHRVQSVRAHKEINKRVDEPLGAQLLDEQK